MTDEEKVKETEKRKRMLENLERDPNQPQFEVLLEEGYFKQIGMPEPILENGVPKMDMDGTPWMQVELEELVKPIR